MQLLRGDWRELRRHAPFRLLFADGGKAKQDQPDDLTPEEYWPDKWKGRPDSVHDFWLNSDRVRSTEVRVTGRHAVLLASQCNDVC